MAVTVSHAGTEASMSPVELDGFGAGGGVVLVVEDDRIDRQLIKEILVEDGGYQVVLTSSAELALGLLESRTDIRLVITDVNMPGGMDGFHLARRVAERWPAMRIVTVSGHDHQGGGDVPRGAYFLYKAYLPSALLGLVQKLMSDRVAAPLR